MPPCDRSCNRNRLAINAIKVLALAVLTFACVACGKGVQHQAVSGSDTIQALRREAVTATAPSCFQNMELVELKSSRFNRSQLAYFYKASAPLRPLVVSLHSWGTTYDQKDPLAVIAKQHDWNYIHPDYGGAQFKDRSCCYHESIQDIDDAAAFGLQNGSDPKRIAFIGKSGGATGVLAGYLESAYANAWYLAWAPIPDQVSWHDEVLKSPELSKRYLDKILEGTKSQGKNFNVAEAKLKSPFYFDFGTAKYPQQKKLKIYAGIRDGLDGWSTSLSQPIAFYNKLISNLPDASTNAVVATNELTALVRDRKAVQSGNLGSLGPRKIVHRVGWKNIDLVIFDGGHEMLEEQAVKDLEQAFAGQP